MHDLHAADKIHRLVIKAAEDNKLKKVEEINIELGCVIEHGAAIDPENLEFNLNLLNDGTVAEKSTINISKTQGNTWKLVDIKGE